MRVFHLVFFRTAPDSPRYFADFRYFQNLVVCFVLDRPCSRAPVKPQGQLENQDWRVEFWCLEHTFMSWSQYEPVRAPCHGVSRTAARGLGPVASMGVTYQWLERGAAYGYKKSPCRSAAASTLVWLAGRFVFESLPCCKRAAKTLTQDYA